MAINPFTGFVDFLAKMGLILRGDPPRAIDLTGREWGKTVGGVALSIREIRRDEPGQLASVSAILKNEGGERIPLAIPGWILFYRMEIGAPLTAYGRALLQPGRSGEAVHIVLGPGDATETDLPVGSIFDLHNAAMNGSARGRAVPLRVSCQLSDGAVVRSNEIRLFP